ncbi:transmembrane protein, putative (macronuclear) [Tetrahymena thermophila SB210]|uniref:Transmembrane protein, putative n=1 Tax=Tetrahymena thermophila (strain SB210) TaxID=312017 RepID=W7X478_TETTS|nr:transmembrane protein, putative [Tetrahymena thermophila SB210]EWS72242.1 transmembrane protein, putative [Tetrahymena thermophila SB210]|eukprot:XP_012655182.1 transmembrane protein, putative [Tetrahymena thermophila SB210]
MKCRGQGRDIIIQVQRRLQSFIQNLFFPSTAIKLHEYVIVIKKNRQTYFPLSHYVINNSIQDQSSYVSQKSKNFYSFIIVIASVLCFDYAVLFP